MKTDPIARLLEHGEEHGCIHLTELNEVVQTLELDEEEIEALFERIENQGIDLTDDCARVSDEAEEEIDELQPRRPLVLDDGRAPALPERGRPLPAADRAGGGRALEADRARRQGARRTR